jgi:hypothetical protein
MVGILNLVEKLRREDRLRDLEGGPPLFGSFAELILTNHLLEQTCQVIRGQSCSKYATEILRRSVSTNFTSSIIILC